MCLILFAYRQHPHYPLILLSNRDEFYNRPTAPASFWETAPEVLAGQDLQNEGTWLGITRQGRFAAVTNYRDPKSEKKTASSRGWLTRDFLNTSVTPQAYLEAVAQDGQAYSGFNLLVGDRETLWYYSNQGSGVQSLKPGIYGLSNHLLDTPWPKVEYGKTEFSKNLAPQELPPTETFLQILATSTPFPDEHLPDTGIGLAMERILSPLFIRTPTYGTRASTVLWIDQRDHVTFVEKSRVPDSKEWQTAHFQFEITPTV